MTSTAKYHDIHRQLLAQIGRLAPGDALPQERELAEHFAVSRMTVRQALALLADEGRIYSVRGRGTFVADRRIAKESELTSFSQDMAARGMRAGSRLLRAHETSAGPVVGRDLEIPEEARVFHLERIRLADGLPMCLESVHLPARLFSELLEQPLDGSLYELLARRYRTIITRAEQTLSAVALTGTQADLLGVRPHAPALLARRISADARGRLVERAESRYRADRYAFHLTVRRR